MACDPTQHADLGAIVMQEGLAHVCLVTSSMTLVRAKIETNIPRKRKGMCSQHDKVRVVCVLLALSCFLYHFVKICMLDTLLWKGKIFVISSVLLSRWSFDITKETAIDILRIRVWSDDFLCDFIHDIPFCYFGRAKLCIHFSWLLEYNNCYSKFNELKLFLVYFVLAGYESVLRAANAGNHQTS